MRKLGLILKYVINIFLILMIVIIIGFNYSLFYEPDFKENEFQEIAYNLDVYNQLNFLKQELRQGAGEAMQSIFPEGVIFINALYGLSWAELISNQPAVSKVYIEGIEEISYAIKEIEKPSSIGIFKEELPLRYGAFYRGWSNYLIGKKIQLQREEERDTIEVRKFINTCQEISQTLEGSESPYLESYENLKWPADGIIAVSSLKLYDAIYESEIYSTQLKEWLIKVKSNLDRSTGLIPHSIEAENDKIIEGARGCSQSLILVFLK